MAKKKLQRFAEMKAFDCVFEPENDVMTGGDFHMKGRWHSDYFGNRNPITLELGCGKGEYTIALAGMYPKRNFIGIDIKGARLWRGAKTVDQSGMDNVAFLRMKVEFISNFFAPGEVQDIWLTFSDPQILDHKGTKRLSAQSFLDRYAKILARDGNIHVKTDSNFLYDATLKAIEKGAHKLLTHSNDIYGSGFSDFTLAQREILGVRTFYEGKFLAKKENINYIHFQLNEQAHQT
ncbi:tRNA (guanosine(46)-N7)-methyltransferase TrmB [Cryomorpha ignava]|uniref:tRNA (guanine(46)-N(7))-methyltransferase n=1 Tax=Cryomorpha ignava TaxID=101383 RepID=A0A7K3WMU4_9FLAO|nr:tRNA (guanosine(46)-N7)-methyltransferase TrmB [Cryomorpha ignava]NEN22956.1 tRNA (guanosine(46)-N7)-methyltransferase TrmB [Cryomorpha ignava]